MSGRSAGAAKDRDAAVASLLEEFQDDLEAPFELLGLDADSASRDEVRAAFRRLARTEHPDVSERADAEDRFRRISLAYELLADDSGREALLGAIEMEAKLPEQMQERIFGTQAQMDEEEELVNEVLAVVGIFGFFIIGAFVLSAVAGPALGL